MPKSSLLLLLFININLIIRIILWYRNSREDDSYLALEEMGAYGLTDLPYITQEVDGRARTGIDLRGEGITSEASAKMVKGKVKKYTSRLLGLVQPTVWSVNCRAQTRLSFRNCSST